MINKDGNSQESEIEQIALHGRNVERELVKARFKPATGIIGKREGEIRKVATSGGGLRK